MLYNIPLLVQPKDVESSPRVISQPVLTAVEHDVITFGDRALELDTFARILARRPIAFTDRKTDA